MTPTVCVIIAAHDPHEGRLARVLRALQAQTMPAELWETVLVDNASSPALRLDAFADHMPPNIRIVQEPQLGLSAARRRGIQAARSDLLVLVDDDNALHADYLQRALSWSVAHPQLGAFGGKSIACFDTPPPPWARQFDSLLACRDLGDAPLSVGWPDGQSADYPVFAPIGAGMCIRREAIDEWLKAPSALSDRKGRQLSSGGDNDIVLSVLRKGWQVGYFPQLVLEHLIPSQRLSASYLARLNRAINKSWMQVLTHHGCNPFAPIAPWTVPLRRAKAWFTYRAWKDAESRVRWSGACGHFEGRVRREHGDVKS